MNGRTRRYDLYTFFIALILLLCPDATAQSRQSGIKAIRKDGIYSTYDTTMSNCGVRTYEHYYTYNHLNIINDSGIIYYNGMGSHNDEFLRLGSYSGSPVLGNYTITGDTLYVRNLPVGLAAWGMRIKTYYASYKGFIKNRDTILDWQMVKPYPRANSRLNNYFKFETTPHLLYFIQSKELLGLDSMYLEHKQKPQPKKRRYTRIRE